MNGFLGEYEITIDARSRFLLPAGLRKQLAGENANEFVVNRGIEKCLTLWPKQSWDPIFQNVNMLNDFEPKVRQFRHLFLNGATPVELDTAGRLLLPKSLMEYAGLEKDALLVPAGNKVEIWDINRHKEFIESILSAPGNYSELAKEVMVPKIDLPKN